MKLYTCEYCYNEFEPTRRRVQKYCSNTCRSKAYHYRKAVPNTLPASQLKNENISTTSTPSKTKTETISAAGIGNAAAGGVFKYNLSETSTLMYINILEHSKRHINLQTILISKIIKATD